MRRRVRDLFEQAKAAAPAIIFVDEIDAVGRHRGAGLGGGHDEREQTLNQLLVEMDGFDQTQGVILLASTNRPDILDPALLRPGRFDRQIVVDRPDLEGRKAILAVHGKEKPLAPGVDLDVIARRTPGFTGADLANLMNEAALLSARHNLKLIGLPQLEEAIDRVMAGPERKSRLISEREKRVIAYHEGGHALVAHALPNTDPVHKISIIPRGRALGYTLTLPTEDKFLVRRSELVDELAMLLGGRTAEELIFADPTTGAQNDIDRATTIARQMVTEYGMSDSLGPMRFGHPQGEVFLGRDFTSTPDYSDVVAAKIDDEVRMLIDRAHAAALQVLVDNRDVLDRLARELIVHETLEAERVQELFADVRMWDGDGDPTHARASVTENPSSAPESQSGGRRVADRPDPAFRRLRVTDTNPLHSVPDPEAMTPINRDRIERAVREILEAIGEDPDRDGLARTPTRIAKMYEEIFAGLHEDPSHHLTVTFEADHDEMVMVRDIPVHSMCIPSKERVNAVDGAKRASDVEVGDTLWTLDDDGSLVRTNVVSVGSHEDRDLVEIRAGDRKVRVTLDHPILTPGGYVSAGDLVVGDKVCRPATSRGPTACSARAWRPARKPCGSSPVGSSVSDPYDATAAGSASSRADSVVAALEAAVDVLVPTVHGIAEEVALLRAGRRGRRPDRSAAPRDGVQRCGGGGRRHRDRLRGRVRLVTGSRRTTVNTISFRSPGARTSPTSRARTVASPGCRRSPAWSTASPSDRRCRSV